MGDFDAFFTIMIMVIVFLLLNIAVNKEFQINIKDKEDDQEDNFIDLYNPLLIIQRLVDDSYIAFVEDDINTQPGIGQSRDSALANWMFNNQQILGYEIVEEIE